MSNVVLVVTPGPWWLFSGPGDVHCHFYTSCLPPRGHPTIFEEQHANGSTRDDTDGMCYCYFVFCDVLLYCIVFATLITLSMKSNIIFFLLFLQTIV